MSSRHKTKNQWHKESMDEEVSWILMSLSLILKSRDTEIVRRDKDFDSDHHETCLEFGDRRGSSYSEQRLRSWCHWHSSCERTWEGNTIWFSKVRLEESKTLLPEVDDNRLVIQRCDMNLEGGYDGVFSMRASIINMKNRDTKERVTSKTADVIPNPRNEMISFWILVYDKTWFTF